MWSPNDRSIAYASHLQVATEDQQDTEEYAMPEVELQSTPGGVVEVASIDESRSLKPMSMCRVSSTNKSKYIEN